MKKDEKTGVLTITIHNPDMIVPFVATETDAGVVVKALVSAAAGQNVAVYRQRSSITEYAKLWSKLLQTDLKVANGGFDGPPDLMEEIENTFAWGKEFGLFGENAGISLTTPRDVSVFRYPLSVGLLML